MTLQTTMDKENYIAGLIAGDGHLESQRPRIVIASSNQCYVAYITKLLNDLNLRFSVFYDASATVWKVACYSKDFHTKLIECYDIPSGNKSCTMRAPRVQSTQIMNFLSGLYDAEGWPEIDRKKYLRIRIKMKNRDVSAFIFRSLQERGFRTTMHDKGDGSFVVNVGKRESVKRFLDEFTLLHPKWISVHDFL